MIQTFHTVQRFGIQEIRHPALMCVREKRVRCLISVHIFFYTWQRGVQHQADKARVEDLLKREIEAKKRVELMLRSYKDEVETLNEALKIAALDIAEAAGSEMGSEDEDEFDDAGSDTEPAPPRERTAQKPQTIFVNTDGTFTKQK